VVSVTSVASEATRVTKLLFSLVSLTVRSCLRLKLSKLWKQKKKIGIEEDFEEYVKWTYFVSSDLKFGSIENINFGKGKDNIYDDVYNTFPAKDTDLSPTFEVKSDKEEEEEKERQEEDTGSTFCNIYSWLSSQDSDDYVDESIIEEHDEYSLSGKITNKESKETNDKDTDSKFCNIYSWLSSQENVMKDFHESIPDKHIGEETVKDSHSKFCDIYSWLSSQEENAKPCPCPFTTSNDCHYACVNIN